jgi:hypothetical protein
MLSFEPVRAFWRRLVAWELLPTPGPEGARRDGPVERPWRYYWDHLPKRTAGADFTTRDYQEARQRAEEVARTTLGDDLWERLMMDGHLDVPSTRYAGVTYRLRVGHRVEVVRARGAVAVAVHVPVHQSDVPVAGARVFRPAVPVRA